LPFTVDTSTLYVSGGNVAIGNTNPNSSLEIGSGASHLHFDGALWQGIGMNAYLNKSGTAWVQDVATSSGAVFQLTTNGDFSFRKMNSGGINYAMYIDPNGNVGIGMNTQSHLLQLGADDAVKPLTNTWFIASDRKLKKNITPFQDGLNVIAQINPVNYQLNGLAGLPKDADGIGIIAEDMQGIAPYTIKPFKARMHPENKNEKEIELLGFNSGALTFVMINAIKEQQKQIDELKAEIVALKSKGRQ
jgi:hypothetical protein